MEKWVLGEWCNVVLEKFSLPAKRKIELYP
jgi:hypothetical protein